MAEMPVSVSDLMSTGVFALRTDDMIALADEVIQLGHIRHLPVVDEKGVVCGILTQRDLLRALIDAGTGAEAASTSISVGKVMVAPVITATPGTPLHLAAHIMRKRSIGCLPVVDAGRLVGVLTESDFVGAFTDPALGVEDETLEPGPFRRELELLHRMRDELRLHLHLAAKDTRDRFEEAERRWHQLDARLRRLADESQDSLEEARGAAAHVLDELRSSYADIKKLLTGG
jgi:CBS domain-containing membrane protein